MSEPLRVLIVDDVHEYAEMVAMLASQLDIQVSADVVDTYDAAVAALATGVYDAAVVDYWLDRHDGATLLGEVRDRGVETPVIILTGAGCEAMIVDVLRRGAADYLSKATLSPDGLSRALRHATALRDRERQKRKAEAALRASEARFRALVENSSDALLLLDGDGRVSFITPSAERHLGVATARLFGHAIFEFLHPDDVNAASRLISEACRRPGERVNAEFRFRRDEGGWRSMECVGVNRLGDPAVRGIVVNARDVTERRRLEEQLRMAQKMEAVGQLAGGIAHDFNNLLTAILGYCSLLLENAADGSALKHDLDEIRSAGERAAMLTRQLLAFGRRQMLRPRVLDLNGLVTRLEPMLRGVLGDGIELVATRSAMPPVEVDPASIEQVLVNLTLNARDALPDGGRVTIATGDARFDRDDPERPGSMPPGRYALLVLADTGAGMDAETRTRLFEPFFTTKEQGKGSGLGLASVYGIVKQSGGFIWVFSEPGTGTTFKIYFPAALTAAAEGAATAV